MRITCDVIKDLLPLYVEGMDSGETHSLVEEHLRTCECCKKELEEMRSPSNLPIDTDILPLKKIKHTLQKRKLLTVLFSVIFTLTIVGICAGYAFSPQFIDYYDGLIQISENDNDIVSAKFKDTVADYEIISYYSEEFEGQVYYITAWDTTWNKLVSKNTAVNIPLNIDGELISSVYYSPNDGAEDILLYGNSLFINGGGLTVPQPLLAYLALFMGFVALLLGLVIFVLCKNKKNTSVLMKLMYLPLAYLLAHFVTKGFNADSYLLLHDLFTITLIAIPLYILALLIECLFRKSTFL